MASKSSIFSLASLTPQDWAIVTSYLSVESIKQLLLASNKTLRVVLLKQGGVGTLQLTSRADIWPFTCWSVSSPPLPLFFDESSSNRVSITSLPPRDLFSALRSLVVVEASVSGSIKTQANLGDLPTSLTHLEWCCDPPIWIGDNDKHTFASALPNLLHLSFWSHQATNCFSAFSFFSALPPGLLSLRVALNKPGMMFVHAKKLPQNLTKLCIIPASPQPSHSPLLLDKPDAAQFPSSITALHLPEHHLNPLKAWIFPGITLTSLALKSISKPESIEHLPSTLTDLRLENFRVTDALLEASPEGHRASSGALWAWPPKMENLTVGLWPDGLPLACPPTVTKFKVLAPLSPRKNPLRKSYPTLPPSVKYLELPFTCLGEDALDSIPKSLVKLTVLDIRLRGISIPKDIEAIETMAPLRTYFDKVPRPYHLVILRPYNSTKKEQLVEFQLEEFNSLQRLTLNNYNHSTNLRIQPRTLTHLAFIPLTDSMVLNLPPTLVKLIFHQIEQDDPIVVSNLLRWCPNLTRVKTALPEHLNSTTSGAIKATLALTWHHLPKDCYDLCSDIKPPRFKSPVASPSTVDAAATLAIASNMLPLTLPEDAWNTFQQAYPGVKFRGFNYDYFQLLRGVRTLMTSRTTINGVFLVRKEFLETGFQPGLEFADLSMAAFTRSETRELLHDQGFPILPETVTELLLGPYLLRAQYRVVNRVLVSPIPKSVKRLKLDYGTDFIVRQDLKNLLPKSVTRLELCFKEHCLTASVLTEIEKHFKILGSGGKSSSKATSSTHLIAVRPEGKDTNSCSIM